MFFPIYMDVDDILGAEFPQVDSELTRRMNELASTEVLEAMREVCGGDEKATRHFFYSSLRSLNGKRPYDLCKDENYSPILDACGIINFGVHR